MYSSNRVGNNDIPIREINNVVIFTIVKKEKKNTYLRYDNLLKKTNLYVMGKKANAFHFYFSISFRNNGLKHLYPSLNKIIRYFKHL